ncbi:MAG: ECF transporter S component [Candidatus Bathyarchaeota archaeon]|nr:ECF transporter S component [Candidatus Bathyarchaeota archaeon]
MKAVEIAMIGVCAALYAVVGRLTDLGIVAPVVGVVAFWPAAVIPAIFAVLFGSWTGGIGAAIGIFIRDMLFHGDPFLSLSAGVTSNFAMFFLIGYISRKELDWKKISLGIAVGVLVTVLGFLLPTILLPTESIGFTGLSATDSTLLFFATVVGSCLLVIAVSFFWPKWRNFGIASIIGLGVGSSIIGVVLWIYSQLFFSPTGIFTSPVPTYFILLWFVWTFATEIPFIMVLGPPIIKATYKAFPSLQPQETTKRKGQ